MGKKTSTRDGARSGPTSPGHKASAYAATDKELQAVKRGTFERVSSARFEAAERELRKLFGRNVREARHRAGLTQADVGAIIDSDQPYVGAIERGEQNVTLATLTRIAYAVRTDPGALLLGETAENYSLETLVRIVGALHSYLQTTIDQQGGAEFNPDMLTIIPKLIPSLSVKSARTPRKKS
jgi:transcriptional regulator with XRE-family HTH domain